MKLTASPSASSQQVEGPELAHAFSLTIQLPDREDVNFSGELTDDEHARIRSFLDQWDDLRESKPVRSGMPCSFKLHWDLDSGFAFQGSLPDDDTLGILLHRLRPFVLAKEPASFDRVRGIVGRRVNNKYVRLFLDEHRDIYDGRQFQQQIQISTHQGLLNSESMLQDWLNSHEYHRDPDKREAVAELLSWLPGDLGKAIFISMLVDKLRAIGNLAAFCSVLVGRTPQLQLQVHDQPTDSAGNSDWASLAG